MKTESSICIRTTIICSITLLFTSCWYHDAENPTGSDHYYCHAYIKVKNNSKIPICCYYLQCQHNSFYLCMTSPTYETATSKSFPLLPEDKYWISMVDYSCIESIITGKNHDEDIPEIIICDTFNFSKKPYGIINSDSTITYNSHSYVTEERLFSNFHVLKRVNINDTSLDRLKETDFTIYYP